MENAYPNPFNPKTYIAYNLAESANVNISVFDLQGRQIKTLFKGHQPAGNHHIYWNGSNENGSKVPSGNYIIRMQTENSTQIQKVMLIK
jgi:flagellar hook assembly protein FlgD